MMKFCLIPLMLLMTSSSFALSNSDVVAMVQRSSIVLGRRGEISVDEIINKINASENGFRLMPEDVKHLRHRHVPELVINAMFARNINETTPFPENVSTPPQSERRPRGGQSLTLKEGTPVRLRLLSNLSSSNHESGDKLQLGDKVEFEVLEDVLVNGGGDDKFLVIAREASAWGTITAIDPTKLMGHYGTIEVALDAVKLASGDKVALSGTERGDRHVRPGLITFVLAPIGSLIQPKDPVWLAAENRDSVIKDGRDFKVFTDGVADLDSAEFVKR